ncbi:hypothetical protein QEH38_gp33 [Mycobacterium phage LilSpotty]|uniref:Holin n=1 Tax=Mycobacterium phage LilSpotty TaxID=2588512 RepID=A0A4Y6ENX2_9CAUD|nr:hypothetical protein QEH38_gp33 [Mycobacterium phage LilSpotty]QDF19765.1 hypothetical protein SEA_LILSPOTTY_33 [Mycobacterium phage LilSpotty]
MWTLTFWKDAVERALKSAAQAVILALGGDLADFWSLDWKNVAGVALGGAGLSLLTSIGSDVLPVGNKGTASLTRAVEPARPPAS